MGGSLEEDAQGSYYTITLYSKELKEAGGSGTLESYKVYQNGKYETTMMFLLEWNYR